MKLLVDVYSLRLKIYTTCLPDHKEHVIRIRADILLRHLQDIVIICTGKTLVRRHDDDSPPQVLIWHMRPRIQVGVCEILRQMTHNPFHLQLQHVKIRLRVCKRLPCLAQLG